MPLLARLLPLALVLRAASASNAEGRAFLKRLQGEPDVVALSSGLMYTVLQSGSGTEHPKPGTTCSCHYEGRVAQEYSKVPLGKIFDSSYARGEPTSFAPNQVIAGWTEAMQLMVAGDKWRLYIPSELGYGESGAGDDIGAGDVLVFTLELLKLEGPGVPLTEAEIAQRAPRGGMGGRGGGRGGGKHRGGGLRGSTSVESRAQELR